MLRAVHRLAPSSGRIGRMSASTFVSSFEKMVEDLPYREAVRYTKDNKKFTAGDVKKHADSLANGLLEFDFTAGDTVGVWLEEEIIHKHIILLAAAKLGVKVVELDNKITEVSDLRKALTLAKCNALFFTPVTASQDNLMLLRKSIPEFFYYDDTKGQPFHSKYFPDMRYFIHTGFDIELGAVHYHHFLLPNPVTSKVISHTETKVKNDLPLYTNIAKGSDGNVSLGATYTHSTALDAEAFGFAKKLIAGQYFEV